VDNHFEVSIADDGCGFDALAYYQGGMQQNGGHGLAVMRERAESIGGKLRVLSLPGRGTEVQVEVPANNQTGRWPWLKR
jgi:signal transduction histidine kinase